MPIVLIKTGNYPSYGCLFFQALTREGSTLASSLLLPRRCANFKQNQISDFPGESRLQPGVSPAICIFLAYEFATNLADETLQRHPIRNLAETSRRRILEKAPLRRSKDSSNIEDSLELRLPLLKTGPPVTPFDAAFTDAFRIPISTNTRWIYK